MITFKKHLTIFYCKESLNVTSAPNLDSVDRPWLKSISISWFQADSRFPTFDSCCFDGQRWSLSSLLLLLSGDVELNPGPYKDSGDMEGLLQTICDKILTEKDFNGVVSTLEPLKSRWKDIGLKLGIRPSMVEAIAGNSLVFDVCLGKVIKQWLLLNYVTAKYSQPSWRRLAEVVSDLDRSLFFSIAYEHRAAYQKSDHVHPGYVGLSNKEVKRLEGRNRAESEVIIGKYRQMFPKFCASLEERSVPVKKLVISLLKLKVYDSAQAQSSNEIAFAEQFSSLREATCVEEVLKLVDEYSSFVSYKVLKHLIQSLGTSADKEQLTKYESELHTYANHWLYNCPFKFGSVTDQAKLFVSMKNFTKESTLSDLMLLVDNLCRIFTVSTVGVLRLYEVKRRNMELVCLMPHFVQGWIFPLSKEQEQSLRDLQVLELSSAEYSFKSNKEDKAVNLEKNVQASSSNSSEYSLSEDEFENDVVDGEEMTLEDLTTVAMTKPLVPVDCSEPYEFLQCFTRSFELRYGSMHPLFLLGSLDEALSTVTNPFISKNAMKPLFIYLHHDGNVLSNVFCTQTLCSEVVVNYLTSNYIAWAWDFTLDAHKLKLYEMIKESFGAHIKAKIATEINTLRVPVILLAYQEKGAVDIKEIIKVNTLTLDSLMTKLLMGFEENRASIVEYNFEMTAHRLSSQGSSDTGELEARVSELEKQLVGKMEETYQLKQQLSDSDVILKEEKERVVRVQGKLEEDTQIVSKLRKEVRSGKETERRMHKELKELRDTFDKLQKELKGEKELVSRMQTELMDKVAFADSLQQQLLEKDNMCSGLHDQLMGQRDRHAAELQHHQQQFREEQVKYQQLSARIEMAISQLRGEEVVPQSVEMWELSREDIHVSQSILGTGGWGYVAKGTFRGQRVAVKCLHRGILSAQNAGRVRREIGIMAQVRHPNLLLLIGAVLTNEGEGPLIVTELLDRSLRSAYEQGVLEEKSKLPILRDVASALTYLHAQRTPIIHRDVSSGNVLLEQTRSDIQWKAKLSDFGSANLSHLANTPAEGSPVYSAPEVSTETRAKQTVKIDVYSFGVLLCEVFLCRFPPDRDEFHGMLKDLRRLQKAKSIFPVARDCTNHAHQVRPHIKEVLEKIDQIIESKIVT